MLKQISEYDIKLLKIFIAIVEHGSFSSAASAIGISRSTISIHMSTLETRLGYKLCNRGRSGFSLTKQGREIYNASLTLLESFNEFSVFMTTLEDKLAGELVILCADQLDQAMQVKLGDVIKRIHDAYPKLNITLDGGSIDYIEKQLLAEKAHIGLYPCYHNLDGLEYQSIYSEPIYLCCGERHEFFELTDSQISQEILSKANAIHPGVDVDSRGRAQLNKLNLSAKSYQFDTRKAMILSGCYIGYLPQSSIQQELNMGKVRIIKPSEYYYRFELSLTSKPASRELQKVNIAKEAFQHVFKMTS